MVLVSTFIHFLYKVYISTHFPPPLHMTNSPQTAITIIMPNHRTQGGGRHRTTLPPCLYYFLYYYYQFHNNNWCYYLVCSSLFINHFVVSSSSSSRIILSPICKTPLCFYKICCYKIGLLIVVFAIFFQNIMVAQLLNCCCQTIVSGTRDNGLCFSNRPMHWHFIFYSCLCAFVWQFFIVGIVGSV